VSQVLSEVKRILRPGGTFISITFSQPHFRVPLLATSSLHWAVRVDKVDSTCLPSYAMQMREGDPSPALQTYCAILNNNNLEEDDYSESSEDESFLGRIDPNSDSEDEGQSR
jgi:ubiquinone/menaquinone biosynthesis C-methylase UbiE